MDDKIHILDEDMTNNEEETEYLCFVNLKGKSMDDVYCYEFIFSTQPDSFWGENFEYMPCCLCDGLKPSDEYVTTVSIVNTKIKLNLIQDSCCFSFQDCTDGVVALAYESLEEYDEYPENGRIVLQFGEEYNDVSRKLAAKSILLM